MSEDSNAAKANPLSFLLDPNPAFSGWLFSLGLWGLLLGILNVLHIATPTGDKIVWASILSIGIVGGEYLSNNPDFRLYSDTGFLALSAMVTGLGLRGILAGVEGGIVGWLEGVRDAFWPSLVDVDSEGGWNSTLSAWFLVIGLGFYLIMGLLRSGWMDPGVYSVAAPFIAFGIALRLLTKATATEGAHSSD